MVEEYRVTSQFSFEKLCDRVRKVVPMNGFGILAEIRTSDNLRMKGFEYPDIRTFDICNPEYAIRALGLDKIVETLIPCRLIVRNDGKISEVSVQLPGDLFRGLGKFAEDETKYRGNFLKEVESRLKKIVDQISE